MRNVFPVLWLLLLLHPLMAQQGQQYARIGSLPLEQGGSIENCFVGYRTAGTLNRAKSNIILFPTWFGGVSEDLIKTAVTAFQLDTASCFIIAADAIGNGISSSPSNSKEQPGQSFPAFTMRDIVNSQKAMLRQVFGVDSIYGIIGGSMGAMQAFTWAAVYPGFARKVLAYVGSPQASSNDMLAWNFHKAIIETGRAHGAAEPEIRRLLNMYVQLASYSPAYRISKTPREKFQDFLSSFNNPAPARLSLDDYLAQVNAMLGHDVARYYDGSLEAAAKTMASAAAIYAIVNLQDRVVSPQPCIHFEKLGGCSLLLLDNECGHIIMSCEAERVRNEIQRFFSFP